MLASTRLMIRSDLCSYKRDLRTIEEYRESVLYPHKESDDNFGGGRGNAISKTTESVAIKLAVTPSRLEKTIQTVEAIDKMLEMCLDEKNNILTEDHYMIAKSKYIDAEESLYNHDFKGRNNELVAHDCNMGVATVKRKDREILEVMRLLLDYR